jgi:hypothetical protein
VACAALPDIVVTVSAAIRAGGGSLPTAGVAIAGIVKLPLGDGAPNPANAAFTAAMSGRSSGRLASSWASRLSSAAGSSGTSARADGGGAWRCLSQASPTDAQTNGGLPVASSNARQPSEYTSARPSTLPLARHCSGDMYAGVPIALAVPVMSIALWVSLAMPKSRTLTRSPLGSSASGTTNTLSGLRSRWMMPAACVASSTPAICLAMSHTRSTGNRPARRTRRDSGSPSSSSITR